MANLISILFNLMPHRLVGAALRRHAFTLFAASNGLVYIGNLQPDDEGERVRGFTAHTKQVDSHVMQGQVVGHDVTILQRTVPHRRSPGGQPGHAHTWLIARIDHNIAHSAPVLFLSHTHKRLQEEAAFVTQARSKRLDFNEILARSFSIYGKLSDSDTLQAAFDGAVRDSLIKHPEYDYEVDDSALYVYSQVAGPVALSLANLLRASLEFADAYDSRH